MNTGKGANRAHILKRCKDTVSSSSLKSFCVFMSSEFAFITTSFVPLSSSFCKKKGKCEVFLSLAAPQNNTIHVSMLFELWIN